MLSDYLHNELNRSHPCMTSPHLIYTLKLFTLISYSIHVQQTAALLLAAERSVVHDVRVLSGHKLRAWPIVSVKVKPERIFEWANMIYSCNGLFYSVSLFSNPYNVYAEIEIKKT